MSPINGTQASLPERGQDMKIRIAAERDAEALKA